MSWLCQLVEEIQDRVLRLEQLLDYLDIRAGRTAKLVGGNWEVSNQQIAQWVAGTTLPLGNTSEYVRFKEGNLEIRGGAFSIHTGATGARMTMDGTELKGYDSGGNLTVHFDWSAGSIWAKSGGFGGTAANPVFVLDSASANVFVPQPIYLGDDDTGLVVGGQTPGGVPYIESTNFSTGSAGWRIDNDGDAEFNSVTVRGTIYASSGQITGALTVGSGGYISAGSDKVRLDYAGLKFLGGASAENGLVWYDSWSGDLLASIRSYNAGISILANPNIETYSPDIFLHAEAHDSSSYEGTVRLRASRGTDYVLLTMTADGTDADVQLQGGDLKLGESLSIDGSIDKSTAIGCKVYRSTTQTIADDTWTAISYSHEIEDTDGCWASGNPTRLVAQRAGTYLLVANFRIITYAIDNARVYGGVVKNGSATDFEAQNLHLSSSDAATTPITVTAVVVMDEDDYLEVKVLQATGDSRNIYAATSSTPSENSVSFYRIA